MRGRPLLCLASAPLVLAACSTRSHVTIAPPARAPDVTDAPSPTEPTTVDAVQWGSCAASDQYDVDGWECGTIEVPLDYAAAGAKTISLALTRLPATGGGKRIGSLVVNPGGPGGSGIEAVHYLSSELPDGLRAGFDLVGFDPRGVGASTSVTCIADPAKDAEADLDPTPDTPEEVGALVDQRQAAAEACAASQGDLLPYVGTMSSARDLDRIRQAVGDDQLTYLGFSYGTGLGATYADLFPDKVRALVLDGSVDPTAGVDGNGQQAGGSYGHQEFPEAFDRFARACLAVTTCSAAPDPEALLGQVRAEAEKAPLAAPTVEAEDGRRLTTGLVESGVASALFDSATWPFLAVGLRDAAQGDGSTLIRLADNLNGRERDGTWDNFLDAYRAVTCADFPVRPTATDVQAALSAVAGTGAELPTDAPKVACLDWPKTAEPLAAVTEADTPPILVIGTRGDPATPYQNAPAMADALGHGVVLTWEGDGHTAFPKTACVVDAVTRYLVDVEAPAAGTVCPAADGAQSGSTAGSPYELDRDLLRIRIEEGFKRNGTPADLAACIMEPLSKDLSDDEFVHFFLGIDEPALTQKITDVATGCGGVFGS